jgi:hypothetical protein
LKDFEDDQCKGELTETCSPVCCFKGTLSGTAVSGTNGGGKECFGDECTGFLLVQTGRGLQIVDGGHAGFVLRGLDATILDSCRCYIDHVRLEVSEVAHNCDVAIAMEKFVGEWFFEKILRRSRSWSNEGQSQKPAQARIRQKSSL